MSRPKLTRKDLVTRSPYSKILAIIASKNIFGEGVTQQELLLIGIPLQGKMRTGKHRTVDKTRLYRIMKMLVDKKLVVKQGRYYFLKDTDRLPLSVDINRKMLTANIIDSGKAGDELNTKIVYPVSWGISYTDTFRGEVEKYIKELGGKWALAVIGEIQRRIRENIINVRSSSMAVQEKAYTLMRLHEQLDEELIQLGWVIEEVESESLVPDPGIDTKPSTHRCLGEVRYMKPHRLNEDFLSGLGVFKLIRELYENNGLAMVENDNELRREIRKINKEKSGNRKNYGGASEAVISERITTILQPLMSMNEPMIISTIALPCDKAHLVGTIK